MNTLRTAAQQALEAMETAEVDPHSSDAVYKAITDLRAALANYDNELAEIDSDGARCGIYNLPVKTALAEPVQEPVAWRFQSAVGGWAYGSQPPLGSKYPVYPLYTAPPQRKPLTEEEISKVAAPYYGTMGFRVEAFAHAIERAHGIGEKE